MLPAIQATAAHGPAEKITPSPTRANYRGSMIERALTIATPDGPMEAILALPAAAGGRSPDAALSAATGGRSPDAAFPAAAGGRSPDAAFPGGPGPHPAVVIVQEAFGVNDHIRDVCRRFAAEGYVALAPELYHRQGRGLVFAYDDLVNARVALRNLENDHIATDVVASLAALRAMPEVAPSRVGIVGYCMGGYVAFLAACRTDVRSTVVYYGGGIVNPRPGFRLTPVLPEADGIASPLLGLFGADDTSVPVTDVDAIRARLTALGKPHDLVVYEGAGHGFSCDPRSSYHPEAAKDAWSRTMRWLSDTMPA